MASRVIVKGLPTYLSDERLKQHFAAFGEVTDARLQRTKDGRPRQFAFVGFKKESEAHEAVAGLNRSFLDTARISVELALAPGSENLARPWSRYASGSSANKKKQDKPVEVPKTAAPKGRAAPGVPAGAKKVKKAAVKAGKAGVGAERTQIEFASDSEAEAEPFFKPTAPPRALEGDAFDEDLDDLAYLRRKSAAKSAGSWSAAEGLADAGAGEGKKKKKKGKKGAKGGDEGEGAEGEGAEAGAVDGDGKGPAAAAAEQAFGEEDGLDATGRLYVNNLPYGTTEEELQAHFETLGEVGSVYVCKDEDTLKSRGFGFVNYVFQECAVRALAELDSKSFQGRLLRISAAKSRPPPKEYPEAEGKEGKGAGKGGGSSYKRERELQKRKVEAHQEHTWNLLYISANAAADASAKQLGLTKGEVLGKDAENVAVTAALAETSVINQTKNWLRKEGIRIDAFEQAGSSLTKSKALDEGGRRDDTFIVKHLPSGASAQELRERFARYGELVRCSLAPSGTVAIVQYLNAANAKRGFQKSAFAPYQHVPLYLEWAPQDVFSGPPPAAAEATKGGATGSRDTAGGEEGGDDDDEKEAAQGCLFVKNLAFSTTEAGLKSAFGGCRGFRSAVVMRKKGAVSKGQKEKEPQGQSMGYGFLEFATAEHALEALKGRQAMMVDGHALQLQVSQRNSAQRGQGGASAAKGGKKPKALTTSRICVRNLAFEATRKDILQLFSAYGQVMSCRLPKKADYSGHRGFAFVDFSSKSEAAAAFEALQHTHLYGRRLVIEAAEEAPTDVASVQQAAQKRKASAEKTSEAKKRRVRGILNASGEADESFKDAME